MRSLTIKRVYAVHFNPKKKWLLRTIKNEVLQGYQNHVRLTQSPNLCAIVVTTDFPKAQNDVRIIKKHLVILTLWGCFKVSWYVNTLNRVQLFVLFNAKFFDWATYIWLHNINLMIIDFWLKFGVNYRTVLLVDDVDIPWLLRFIEVQLSIYS